MSSDPQVSPDQPSPAAARARGAPRSAVKMTRTGATWAAFIVGLVVLVVLLVFVAQNTDSTEVHLFGWNWRLPLGVALLFAAVCGALVAVLAGSARIIQLRRAAKKNLQAHLAKYER